MLYISIFLVAYGFSFTVAWLVTIMRKDSSTQHLATMSPLGINIFAGLVASYAVFSFRHKGR